MTDMPDCRVADAATQPQAYASCLLAALGDRNPIEVLNGTPAALRHLVAGRSTRALSTPEAPGKWSVRQILQHLADDELVGGYRLRMVLAHDRPAVTGYDQDLWAERLHYQDADIETALGDFETLRRANLRLLAYATPADYARVMHHMERGEESLAQMIRISAGHDLVHRRQAGRVLGV